MNRSASRCVTAIQWHDVITPVIVASTLSQFYNDSPARVKSALITRAAKGHVFHLEGPVWCVGKPGERPLPPMPF